jgi:hypothetical protein
MMQKVFKNKLFVLSILTTFILSGCFSSSMMTTAKTLDKGEQEFVVGVSGYLDSGSPAGIAPDLVYRRGINDKMDFGVGYSMGLLGHIRSDIKYELMSWNNGQNFLSTGFGLDAYIPDEFGDTRMFGSTIPLYLSLNHDQNVTPYFAQRFTFGWHGWNTYRYINSPSTITSFTSIRHKVYYSGAAGLRIGEERKKYFIECSYAYHGENYFGAWEAYDQPGEFTNTQSFHRNLTFQLTLGILLGNK